MWKTAYEQAICLYQRLLGNGTQPAKSNLVPRVLRLFGRLLDTRRDSGVLEFYYWRISAVKQCKPLWGSQSKHLNFFKFPRASPGDQPLAKESEDSGYEIGQSCSKSPTLDSDVKLILCLNSTQFYKWHKCNV